MRIRFKTPPCHIGPLNEKPRAHKWEIKLDIFGRPIVKLNADGLFVYHTACTRCGLNDKNPPRF